MNSFNKSIDQYTELYGRLGRIFYDEVSLCVLDFIVKLYFQNFIFEVSEVIEKTNLDKKIINKCLYKFRGIGNNRCKTY